MFSSAHIPDTCLHLQNLGSDMDYFKVFFYVLLTVHLGITLANDQLDAQLLYFAIRLLQSSTCFVHRRAHHQEVKLY